MARMRRRSVLGMAGVLLFASAGSASAASPGQIQAFLNQQRAVNGIPGVSFSPGLSDGCDKHNRYMQLNNYFSPQHGESPGQPGYTPEGADQSNAEVLSSAQIRSYWSPTSNPWASAPIHLAIAFDPELTQAGGADSHGFECLRLNSFWTFAGPTLSLFTGPRGRTNVPLTETAYEAPYVPQTLVGIPTGRKTGYQLIAYANDIGSYPDSYQVQSASLTGPSGPVTLRVVDSRFSQWDLPDAAVIIPIHAFAPHSNYTGQVVWHGGDGRLYTNSFSFTTAGQPSSRVHLKLSNLRVRGRRILLALEAPKAAVGQRARVRVYLRRRGHYRVVQRKTIRGLRREQVLRLRLHIGQMSVVVTTKSFTRHGVRYRASTAKQRFSIQW